MTAAAVHAPVLRKIAQIHDSFGDRLNSAQLEIAARAHEHLEDMLAKTSAVAEAYVKRFGILPEHEETLLAISLIQRM